MLNADIILTLFWGCAVFLQSGWKFLKFLAILTHQTVQTDRWFQKWQNLRLIWGIYKAVITIYYTIDGISNRALIFKRSLWCIVFDWSHNHSWWCVRPAFSLCAACLCMDRWLRTSTLTATCMKRWLSTRPTTSTLSAGHPHCTAGFRGNSHSLMVFSWLSLLLSS